MQIRPSAHCAPASGVAMQRYGDSATQRYGDSATQRYGDSATQRYGDSATHRYGARAVPAGFLASLPDFHPATILPMIPATVAAMRFADVRVAAAELPEEFEAARGLVRERYAWRGYQLDAMGGATQPCMDARLGHEITFVAARRGTTGNATVGTITLRLDGPLGLRAEGTHRDIVQRVRDAGRRVCELTRLAVADSEDSKSVLASLFNLAYATGETIHGVTDVFIEVNPRHVAFYSRVLGFVVAAGETFCERVRAPSVLLHVRKEALAERLAALVDRALMPPPLLARAA